MKHTYKLKETIISKEARVQNKAKEEINRSFVLESFSRVFLFLCFPVTSQSFFAAHNRIIFANSTYHENKEHMPLTFTLLVAWSTLVLVLILVKG